MDERPSRILLIDGDRDSYVRLRKLLSRIGDAAWQLEWTESYESGLESIRRGDHDLYLVDEGLACQNGQQLLHEARGASAQAAVIVLFDGPEPAAEPEALQHGAADYLPRANRDASQLRRALRHALERRRWLRELERERYLLRALMEHLPDNIYFKDINSRFLCVSKEMARWFGLDDPAEAVGLSDADFFTQEHALQARQDEIELMRSGQPILRKEEKETWPDERVTWVNSSKLPLHDRYGRVVGTFGVSRDISRQKQAEQDLLHAKDAAEAASRAKSTFLATMSHEIRTPLNAVIGVADLLQETTLTTQQREYLAMVQESGESLLAIIEDILDFSKIEAGRLDFDEVDFNLRDRLGDALRSLALRAHRKDLELAWHVADDVPMTLRGDPGRLRQIIVNLVNNAIKFTEQGEVVLRVELADGQKSEVRSQKSEVRHEAALLPPSDLRPLTSDLCPPIDLHFTVRDTGIGVPSDKLSLIFEAFEQVDSSTTRRYEGTGLGLAICRRLAELMHGRIWVESQLGAGSKFHFMARFVPAAIEVPAVGQPMSPRLAGLRVLVVDDNATNRLILEELLRGWQMQPRAVAGAEEALSALRTAREAQRPFDLILTDSHMPEVDGFMLADRIRQAGEANSTLVMMLTSGDRPGDLDRSRELGIAAYLLKPVRPSELLEAIARAIGMPADDESRLSERAAATALRVPPLRVLLAEDSVINQKLARGLLEHDGHSVSIACDGREALLALEQETFDLVLMDLQMPEMDGLSATAAIRQRELQTGRRLPIIAMTAHALKGDRERCLASGMDGYVAKPVRLHELQQAISGVWKSCEVPAAEEPHDLQLDTGPINWDLALEFVEGDKELLADVAATFLDLSPRRLAELHRAAASGECEALRTQAHTLKSELKALGASAAAELAASLEQLAARGDLTASPPIINQLVANLDAICHEISRHAVLCAK